MADETAQRRRLTSAKQREHLRRCSSEELRILGRHDGHIDCAAERIWLELSCRQKKLEIREVGVISSTHLGERKVDWPETRDREPEKPRKNDGAAAGSPVRCEHLLLRRPKMWER